MGVHGSPSRRPPFLALHDPSDGSHHHHDLSLRHHGAGLECSRGICRPVLLRTLRLLRSGRLCFDPALPQTRTEPLDRNLGLVRRGNRPGALHRGLELPLRPQGTFLCPDHAGLCRDLLHDRHGMGGGRGLSRPAHPFKERRPAEDAVCKQVPFLPHGPLDDGGLPLSRLASGKNDERESISSR